MHAQVVHQVGIRLPLVRQEQVYVFNVPWVHILQLSVPPLLTTVSTALLVLTQHHQGLLQAMFVLTVLPADIPQLQARLCNPDVLDAHLVCILRLLELLATFIVLTVLRVHILRQLARP